MSTSPPVKRLGISSPPASGTWIPPAARDLRRLTEAIRITPGVGLAGRALVTASATWVADMAEHPKFARAGVAWAHGVRAGAAFPVVSDGRVLAVLELFCEKVVQLDAETLALGNALAAAIARRLGQEGDPPSRGDPIQEPVRT